MKKTTSEELRRLSPGAINRIREKVYAAFDDEDGVDTYLVLADYDRA